MEGNGWSIRQTYGAFDAAHGVTIHHPNPSSFHIRRGDERDDIGRISLTMVTAATWLSESREKKKVHLLSMVFTPSSFKLVFVEHFKCLKYRHGTKLKRKLIYLLQVSNTWNIRVTFFPREKYKRSTIFFLWIKRILNVYVLSN